MAPFKSPIFMLKDQTPREISLDDILNMTHAHRLRVQSDWYDIYRQNDGNPVAEGNISLNAIFIFKCKRNMQYKSLEDLVRHLMTITKDIVYKDESQITSIHASKRVSKQKDNNTIFSFEVDYIE